MSTRRGNEPQIAGEYEALRAGIIGAGRQGWRRAKAICASTIDRILAVYDINADAAKKFSATFGGKITESWQDVLADDRVNAVVVCTPPHLHLEIASAALRAGKHTLCEKPMGRNLVEAEQIAKAALASGLVLKAGYNHRQHPALSKCKEYVDEGRIGEIVFVRGRYGIGGRTGYDEDWRMQPGVSGGGQLMDQGLHLLDLARWFLGDFRDVSAFIHSGFWSSAVEDNAFTLLRTARGQVASLHVSWTQWKNLFSFEVFGTTGYLSVEGLGGSYGTEKLTFGPRSFGAPWREETVEFRGEDESWSKEWLEFRTAIVERREPLAAVRDACEALRLAEAAYEAARTGHTVAISPGDYENIKISHTAT